MADFGRRRGSGGGGGESLEDIARSDQLLDAIAGEFRVQPTDAGEAELFGLLAGWRDEVRWPPATDLVSERDAAAALRDGVNSMPTRGGGHRGLTIVASLAAAVLCIGGFGAVVSGAGPGDPLYGLRTTLLGEPQQVRDDRVALAAKSEMEQVQTLINNGDWQQAQQKLAAVSNSVNTVDDTGTKQQLIDQWNQLAVKVDQQNPAATVPPSAAPGPLEQLTLPAMPSEVPPLSLPSEMPQISVPELPSGLPLPSDFPQIPSISVPPVPTEISLPGLPTMTLPPLPSTLFQSPPGSPSSGPAPAVTTTTPAPATTETSTAAPSSAVPSSTPSAVTTTTAAPVTTTAAPTTTAPQSQSQAATTTAAPATTTPVTTTASQAPSSAVTTTTTAAAAPRAAESQTVEAPVQTAAPTVAQTAPQRAPDVVTTTTPRPILQLPLLGGN